MKRPSLLLLFGLLLAAAAEGTHGFPPVQDRPAIQDRPTIPDAWRYTVPWQDRWNLMTHEAYNPGGGGGGGSGASYYVDNQHPSASNANSGTEILPWLTLYEINNRTFLAGDTIYVKNGTYVVTTGGSSTTPAIGVLQAGSALNRITLRNYPGHTPVIDGQNVAGRFKIGCRSHYNTVRGFRIINTFDHGVLAGGGAGPSRTLGCIIERFDVERITASTTINPEAYKLLWSDGATIRDNLANNSMVSNPGQNVAGIANEHGINSIIENNEAWGFSTGFFDKYGGNGNVFRFNYVHSADLGIIATCFGQETNPCGTGNWHHNIMAFSSNECISTAATTTSTEMDGYAVERNTLHSCAQHGIRVDSAVPSAIITNNYVQSAAAARANVIFGETGIVNFNAYNTSRLQWKEDEDAAPAGPTYTTFAAWQGTGRDANGVTITGTPFTGTPTAGGRDPTVYRPSVGGGLQGVGQGGTHIGAYETDTTVVGIRETADSVAPTDPREVNARAISSSTVEAFWFPSRDNVGVTYRIYRAQVLTWSGGLPLTWTTQTQIGTSLVDGLARRAFLDTGLAATTDYIYWVSAVDPAGNESARVNTAHAAPTTPAAGNTIDTQVTYPASVAPSGNIAITQTITLSPAGSIGHHDVHWGTSPGALSQFVDFAFDGTTATVHTQTVNFAAPASPGNVYFMEDGHVQGAAWTLNGAGNAPHKEGMLFRIPVTNGSPLMINPATLPAGQMGVAYSQTLTATGEGNGVNSWGVSEARLPVGLTLSAAGVVSGTPVQNGSEIFQVMVEDSAGTSAFRTYTLMINP